MTKIHRVQVTDPVLLLGYDWERYGKHGDADLDARDRADSEAGINSIVTTHRECGVPLTLFILGKVLEVDGLRTIAAELIKSDERRLLDIQQHTYSHLRIKDNVLRGPGASISEIRRDLARAASVVEEITGKRVIGLGSAQSFYMGLQGEPERQRAVVDAGIEYIRSDGRGLDDTRPAPSFDDANRYRGPYFYGETPELLEIPAHGYSDNYLKGFSKEKPGEQWSVDYEVACHLEFFEAAIEQHSVFAPLNHEWSIARKDPNADVPRALITLARERGVEISTYSALNAKIRSGAYTIER